MSDVPIDPDDDRRHRFRHHPLLGTMVEIRIEGTAGADVARSIDHLVVEEMARLQAVFSAYDPSSELERWKRGEVQEPSIEFTEVLELALDWQQRSGGAYNPAVGVISAAWSAAVATATLPTEAELSDLAESIRDPRFVLDDRGRPTPTGDCSQLNFNAFAKGWIVDRAVALGAAGHPGIDLVVNAGGDLAHRGPNGVRVGIENPFRPYDNEPPFASVSIANVGLATSGRARKGFRIAGRWHGHVIDPRTGHTVDAVASISVIAPTAAEADVTATIAGVRSPEGAVAYCTEFGRPCLVIDADRSTFENDAWRSLSRA